MCRRRFASDWILADKLEDARARISDVLSGLTL
jgi:hypothetical protein